MQHEFIFSPNFKVIINLFIIDLYKLNYYLLNYFLNQYLLYFMHYKDYYYYQENFMMMLVNYHDLEFMVIMFIYHK